MTEITRWVDDGRLVRIMRIGTGDGAVFGKHVGSELLLSWGQPMNRAEVAEELFARRPKR